MRNFRLLLVAMLCWAPLICLSADRPVLYTLSGSHSKLDTIAEAQFGRMYRLVEINQRQHAYTAPKLTDGFGPADAAITQMNKKHYQPAQLDGKAVSVVIGVLVALNCPPVPK